MTQSIESILVVGAGWIGRQVAAQCAAHGLSVTILDKNASIGVEAVRWAIQHAAKQSAEGVWSMEASALCQAKIRSIEKLEDLTEEQVCCD